MAGKRKGRRARGTGAVFWSERRRRWIGRLPVGRKPDGTTRYREVWGRTQAEVVRKLAESAPPGPAVTVGEWAARWLETIQVRPSTRASYGASVRHVVRHLGGVRVRDLTPGRVEGMVKALCDAGLDPNNVRKVVAELANMLQSAVREGVIAQNPARLARRPRGRKKAIDPFTPAELSRIVAAACGSEELYAVALMAATGCRVGEAVALDVPDFDPAAGTAFVTKTQHPEHGPGPPKSPHSVRVIRVPADALPALVAAAGDYRCGPLFRAADQRRTARRIALDFGRLLRRLGLAPRNPHQLRHSVATAMVSAGVPIGDVAKYLGDVPDTIVKTYVHPSGADPADAMERLLGGRKVGKTRKPR